MVSYIYQKMLVVYHGKTYYDLLLSNYNYTFTISLTHWGRATHICIGKLTIIGSENGLSPGRRQAIIWTNVEILLSGPLGTNTSKILIQMLLSSLKKMRLNVSSAKWRPFCLGLNVLNSRHLWSTNIYLIGLNFFRVCFQSKGHLWVPQYVIHLTLRQIKLDAIYDLNPIFNCLGRKYNIWCLWSYQI